MIRAFDDPAGERPIKFNPRALLQSLERQLSQTGGVTDKNAAAAQQLVYSPEKGQRRRPRGLPAAYAPGSKDEAICFAEELRAAWQKHPAALQWLELQKVK